MSSEDLFRKTQLVFGDLAVNKWLASTHEYAMLPRFVTDYLVSEHYKEARERDKVLHDLMNGSEVQVIDEVKVEAEVFINDYRTHLMNLGISISSPSPSPIILSQNHAFLKSILMLSLNGLTEILIIPL